MRKFVIQATILGLIILGCVLFCAPSHSASLEEVIHVSAGANGVWLEGPGSQFPADVEAGGVAWASLSPHITAFGDLFYGFDHSYLRWDGGAKVTATDVDNPNWNLYLSFKYRGGSESTLQPSEWAAGSGIGWRPNPEKWPRIVVGADAAYGLQSNRVISYLAVRYEIPLK